MGADRDGVGGRRSAVRRLQAPPHPLAVEEAEAEEEEEGGEEGGGGGGGGGGGRFIQS